MVKKFYIMLVTGCGCSRVIEHVLDHYPPTRWRIPLMRSHVTITDGVDDVSAIALVPRAREFEYRGEEKIGDTFACRYEEVIE